ncbi:MAG: hypothetical protein JRH11_24445, partial [Deltaproteobacteria bacterium]|nr:hypothetical protein [Deltaproteobacteria bacterium]
EQAVTEFQLGYALDPNATFLFAWAQAERLSGDCDAAIRLYERFVKSDPPAQQVAAAEQSIELCRQTLAAPPPPEPEPEPEPEPVAPIESEPEPAPVETDKRSPDPAGVVLMALGGVGVAVGGGLLIGASAQETAAEEAENYDDFDGAKAKAKNRRVSGGVVLGLGGALFIVGVIRYAVAGRKASRSTALAPWHDGRAGGLAVAGRF